MPGNDKVVSMIITFNLGTDLNSRIEYRTLD